MSRRGNIYDNALAESFIKTLKYEEVYRTEYRNLEEAKASIKEFLEKVYNLKRLHSASIRALRMEANVRGRRNPNRSCN